MGFGIHKSEVDPNNQNTRIARLYRHVEQYRHPSKLYTRFNYADYSEYNSRNNRIWENECERDGGQLLKNTFTLLTESVPRTLIPFLNLASLMEPKIFSQEDFDISADLSLNNIFDKDLVDPNETPLSRFCRYSNITVEKAIGRMRILNRSPNDFFDILTNVKGGGLLLAIEHLIHEKKYLHGHSDDLFIPHLMSQKKLALYMLQAGAKKATVINVTKLSHSAVDLLLKQFKEHMHKINHKLLSSEPLGFENSMLDTVKSRFAILMISLYLICMRVILNHKAKFHSLSLDGIPENISYTILTGCYLCMRDLYTRMHYPLWSTTYFLEFFPNFNDMCELLKSVLCEKTKLVACAQCHTPYFSFDSINNNRTGVYKRNQTYNTSCPCCASKCEYILE